MEKIGLVEAIDALRSELALAVTKAPGQEIQFPIGSVQLELQVGVTRDTEARGGIRFWVLELGASGSYANESVQKITLNLEAPVREQGEAISVSGAGGYVPLGGDPHIPHRPKGRTKRPKGESEEQYGA